MRPRAHAAAIIALILAQLCATPLLAKPTHSIAASSAGRLPADAASRRSHRELASGHSPSRPNPPATATHAVTAKRSSSARPGSSSHKPGPAAAKVPPPKARPSRRPATQSAATGATSRKHLAPAAAASTISRVHAWEQSQRTAAARSAVDAANAQHETAANGQNATSSPEAAGPASNSRLAQGTASQVEDLAASDLVRTTTELPPIKSIEEEAITPLSVPSPRSLLTYNARGRLVVPPPLYGSHEVLLHQNEMADHDGLTRIEDDASILDLRRTNKLVALPIGDNLHVDPRLPEDRRYSRPWTAQFLSVLARDHYASFHLPLQVDSAVRTVAVQRRLLRTNGNAAPITGETASPHLTGQAIDIAKSALSLTEIAWMRAYLQPLIDAGKIDVEEEFQQACFHISVYKSYLPKVLHRTTVAANPSAPESRE